jgi:hypothetical protein
LNGLSKNLILNLRRIREGKFIPNILLLLVTEVLIIIPIFKDCRSEIYIRKVKESAKSSVIHIEAAF